MLKKLLIVTLFLVPSVVAWKWATNKKIVILAVYHKPETLLKNEVVKPIHAGRSIKSDLTETEIKWLYDNMIGDNTGDNISGKNRDYSELTALYWAWKNYDQIGNPDYMGLIHYRRHLLLKQPDPKWDYRKPYYIYGEILDDPLNGPYSAHNERANDYLKKIGMTKKDVTDVLKNFDVITRRVKIENEIKNTNYHWRKEFVFNENENMNYAKLMKIVSEKYPHMAADVEAFGNRKEEIYANLFIMPKKEFMEYAEFMFTILDVLEKGMHPMYSNTRTLGYWAEELTSFFIHHLESKGLRIKESDAIFMGVPDF